MSKVYSDPPIKTRTSPALGKYKAMRLRKGRLRRRECNPVDMHEQYVLQAWRSCPPTRAVDLDQIYTMAHHSSWERRSSYILSDQEKLFNRLFKRVVI